MSIQNRTYVKGDVDPVFQRVVPTELPTIEQYLPADSPDLFVVDYLLYHRAERNEIALALDLDSQWEASQSLLAEPGAGEAIQHMNRRALSDESARAFMAPLLDGVKTWMTDQGNRLAASYEEAGKHGIAAKIRTIAADPTAESADAALDDLALSLAASEGIDVDELVRTHAAELIGKNADEHIALIDRGIEKILQQSTESSTGLGSRLARKAPIDTRTELTAPEYREFGERHAKAFETIRTGVSEMLKGTPESIIAGRIRLQAMQSVFAELEVLIGEAIARREKEGKPVPGEVLRRREFARMTAGHTALIIELLDPEKTDEDTYVAFMNRANLAFTEDFIAEHRTHMEEHHGEHTEEGCHVKRGGYDMIRSVYRRTVSSDELLDNALPQMDDLAGVFLDAEGGNMMTYALVFHPALVGPANDALRHQLAQGVTHLQELLSRWSNDNLEFLANMKVERVEDILASRNPEELMGEIPPGATNGLGLTMIPGVFVPKLETAQAILADLRAMQAEHSDTDLTVPAEWITPDENGGAE
jgi:hypothetical protein